MYIPGHDAESRLLRKTLVRQCNLMAVLVLRTLSDSVRDRLKTTDDIVSAGMFVAYNMLSLPACSKVEMFRIYDAKRKGML